MEKEQKQPDIILNLLTFLEGVEVSFALLLFVTIMADSFGLAFMGDEVLRDMVFFVCSLFLLQSAIVYLVVYQYYRKSRYGKNLKAFLINLTFLPLFLVIAAAMAFLLEPTPIVYRAYATAIVFSILFSHFFFRQLVKRTAPGPS